MYGDYTGPPEGLAESNRARYANFAIFSIPGLVLAAIGFLWLAVVYRRRP